MSNPAHVEGEQAPGEHQVFFELLHWIERTAVPRSRPQASAADEAAGLVILDLSLRLEHVSRVTDSLRVIDKSHIRRRVTLDVDLRGLTGEQRATLSVRQGLAPADGEHEDGPTHLWVPVSRHSRMDLSPVVVRDGSDQVLPRLTQGAASKTLVAGLGRLMKLIRDSRDEPLAAESMWLIVKALESLIEEGPLGTESFEQSAAAGVRGESDTEGYRSAAKNFLLNMPLEVQQSLDRLIEVAFKEYVLVVMLPARPSQAHLQFEAPLIPAVRPSTSWRRRVTPGREYTIDYHTEIARSLGSYHVTVEVAEEIYVRRYILCSAADRAAVAELGREMRKLAAALPEPTAQRAQHVPELRSRNEPTGNGGRRAPQDEPLWLELEAVMSKLAQIGRRRSLEYRRFRSYIEGQELGRPTMGGESVGACIAENSASTLEAVARGDVSLNCLDHLSDILSAHPFRDVLTEGGLSPCDFKAGLPRIAGWLGDARLGEDVIVENDPRENGAHAQWRHRPLDFGTPSLEPIRARVLLTLADEKPALADSVRHMLVALTAIVAGIGLLLRLTDAQPSSIQADALVAVLLLVPGILLSRLDIPSTNSVLGQLRAVPRTVAYLSVILTSALAVAVAAAVAGKNHLTPFVIVLGCLALCLVFSVIEGTQRSRGRNRGIPDSADVPWWLRNPSGGPSQAMQPDPRYADVVFDAIDGQRSKYLEPGLAHVPEPPRPRRKRASRSQHIVRPGSAPASHEESTRAEAETVMGRRSLRGAELARTAARAVTAGKSGVELVVEHLVDEERIRDGSASEKRSSSVESGLAGLFDAQSGASSPTISAEDLSSTVEQGHAPGPTETLIISSAESTVRVLARPLTGLVHEGPLVDRAGKTAGGRYYVVTAPLGPSAFSTPLRTLNFRVGLPDDRTVAEFLEGVLKYGPADMAGASDVTVREVEFPEASTRSSMDGREAQAQGSGGHVLRLTIAISEGPDASLAERARGEGADVSLITEDTDCGPIEHARYQPVDRLGLTGYLARLCDRLDAHLEITNSSVSAGPHWRSIVCPRPVEADAGQGDGGASEPTKRQDGQVLLVTLAGSSAGYDVRPAISLCTLVQRSAGVGVLSVSVTQLQDQPLISLALSRHEPRPAPVTGTPDADEGDVVRRGAVRALAEFLEVPEDDKNLACAIKGRALLVTLVEPRHSHNGERRAAEGPSSRTLWLQWSWPRSHADYTPPDPVQLVRAALGDSRVSSRLLHQRWRQDRDGRVVGHARLSAHVAVDGGLGKLAHQIERRVQREVAAGHRSPHEVQVRIVRDEGWLPRE